MLLRLDGWMAWLGQLGWQPRRGGQAGVIAVLGFTQWIAWGSTYYLVTVIARPIADDTGWSLSAVIAGLSVGLIVAALVSPQVGKAIERRGGRPVLAVGAAVLGLGLIALALARHPLAYFSAWVLLGVGMGASLADAAFATLGKLYGLGARPLIGKLALIGGLVMTVTWPLSAALVASIGWRGTCLFYAGMHFAVGLPLLWFLLPTALPETEAPPGDAQTRAPLPAPVVQRPRLLVWLLGTNLTLQIGIGSVLAVHLVGLLQGLHLELAAAVALGSLMGACQVGSRLIEVLVARYVHPVWEGLAASLLVLLGFALLLTGEPAAIAIGLVVYGLGNGVRTIVKGTLPLVLFGAEGYAALIGRLGLPTLIAQAAGPALGAVVLTRYGAMPTLLLLVVLALANVALSWTLRIGLPQAPAALPNPSLASG